MISTDGKEVASGVESTPVSVKTSRSRAEDLGLRSISLSSSTPLYDDDDSTSPRRSLDQGRRSLDQPRTSFERRRRKSIDPASEDTQPTSLRPSASPAHPHFSHTYSPPVSRGRSSSALSAPTSSSSSPTASISAQSLSLSSASSPPSLPPIQAPAEIQSVPARIRYSQRTATQLQHTSTQRQTRSTSNSSASPPAGAARTPARSAQGPLLIENFWGEKEAFYTLAQVASHNKVDDCWMILDGKVYDATKVIPHHPGGAQAILNFAGKDASYHIQFHSSAMLKIIEPFYKGKVLLPEDEEKCLIL